MSITKEIKNAAKSPVTWVAFVIGGIAALSFGFIAKILSPAADAVKTVTDKVSGK